MIGYLPWKNHYLTEQLHLNAGDWLDRWMAHIRLTWLSTAPSQLGSPLDGVAGTKERNVALLRHRVSFATRVFASSAGSTGC
jgi:hypothetical protein